MPFLNKLERIFGRFAIPSLSLVLVVGQVLAWLALYRGVVSPGVFFLIPATVTMPGGWWHLFSFLLLPPLVLRPSIGVLFMLLGWWMFYIMGTALEHFWGTFRFNLFILTGFILTVAVGFCYPLSFVTNIFLGGSVFLAFAYLNPDFELMLFMILPMKIKWLALVTWALYLWEIIAGPGPERLQALAIIVNFLLFFGRDLYLTLRLRSRKIGKQAVAVARPADPAHHRCFVCNKTDVSDPQMDFRYCSKCAGDPCYCSDHIFNHTHVTVEAAPK
jgi:hypothetical protein